MYNGKQEAGPNMTFEEAQKKCREAVKNFAEIQLVYGKAGLHFGSSLRQSGTLSRVQRETKLT